MIIKQRLALALTLLALVGAATLLGSPWMNQRFELADLRTASDQQLTRRLDDGSLLEMAADTAVDIEFDSVQRRVTLLEGKVALEVTREDRRPFVLVTDHGTLATHDANVLLERGSEDSRVTLLAGGAELDSGGQRLRLEAGQKVRFGQAGPAHPPD